GMVTCPLAVRVVLMPASSDKYYYVFIVIPSEGGWNKDFWKRFLALRECGAKGGGRLREMNRMGGVLGSGHGEGRRSTDRAGRCGGARAGKPRWVRILAITVATKTLVRDNETRARNRADTRSKIPHHPSSRDPAFALVLAKNYLLLPRKTNPAFLQDQRASSIQFNA
ncbi:MAG: hypothetical protein ACREXR_17640, partial [Gammaproteobacteria bacterium]